MHILFNYIFFTICINSTRLPKIEYLKNQLLRTLRSPKPSFVSSQTLPPNQLLIHSFRPLCIPQTNLSPSFTDHETRYL